MMDERFFRRVVRGLGAVALVAVCLGATVVFATSPATAADEAPAVATNGVIIHWNPTSQQYEAPTAEQAARLFAELQRRLAGDVAARAGLATGPVTTEKLANGMTRVRLPLSMLNLSIVHVGADGSFAESCTQESPAAVDLSRDVHQAEPTGRLEER